MEKLTAAKPKHPGGRLAKHLDAIGAPMPRFPKHNGRFQSHYMGDYRKTTARYALMVNSGVSQRKACAILGVGRSNLRNWLEDDPAFSAMVSGEVVGD